DHGVKPVDIVRPIARSPFHANHGLRHRLPLCPDSPHSRPLIAVLPDAVTPPMSRLRIATPFAARSHGNTEAKRGEREGIAQETERRSLLWRAAWAREPHPN